MTVALNLKNSRYLLYDQSCTDAFAKYYLDLQDIGRPATLEPLILDGIINRKSPRPCSSDRDLINDHRGMRFETFDTAIWGSQTFERRASVQVKMLPLLRIIRDATKLKALGLRALSSLERLPRRQSAARSIGDPAEVVEQYLSASMWSPLRITCLPLSFSIVAHLRRNNIPAELVIGVRPTPFVAHAWVEIDKCAYGNDQESKDSYGEIYRLPPHKHTASSNMATLATDMD